MVKLGHGCRENRHFLSPMSLTEHIWWQSGLNLFQWEMRLYSEWKILTVEHPTDTEWCGLSLWCKWSNTPDIRAVQLWQVVLCIKTDGPTTIICVDWCHTVVNTFVAIRLMTAPQNNNQLCRRARWLKLVSSTRCQLLRQWKLASE